MPPGASMLAEAIMNHGRRLCCGATNRMARDARSRSVRTGQSFDAPAGRRAATQARSSGRTGSRTRGHRSDPSRGWGRSRQLRVVTQTDEETSRRARRQARDATSELVGMPIGAVVTLARSRSPGQTDAPPDASRSGEATFVVESSVEFRRASKPSPLPMDDGPRGGQGRGAHRENGEHGGSAPKRRSDGPAERLLSTQPRRRALIEACLEADVHRPVDIGVSGATNRCRGVRLRVRAGRCHRNSTSRSARQIHRPRRALLTGWVAVCRRGTSIRGVLTL